MESTLLAMRRSLALGAALSAACTGPNPNLDAGEEESSESTDTSADTESGSETDSGETDTDGPTCADDEQNGNETDEDCGGDCDPCADGKMCGQDEDCESGVCDGDACAVPTCDDEVQNGGEFMADCGGPCEVCVLDGPTTNWADPGTGIDRAPSVDMLDDGAFALAWQADGDIRYRWFAADGMASSAGAEAHNPSGGVEELLPAVSVTATDPPVAAISWAEGAGADNARFSLFDNELAAIQSNLLVNQDIQLDIGSADNDLHDGTLFASYGSGAPNEVYFRRFDAETGAALDLTDTEIINETDDGESSPQIAVASSGDALVAWLHSDAGDFDIVGRVRTAGGSWMPADPFVVHVPNTGIQVAPDVAALADDRYVVTWQGDSDHDDQGVIARLVDADGTPVGTDIAVNESTDGVQDFARVAALSHGGFAVAWRDADADTIKLRRFDDSGDPIHAEESPWGATANLDANFPSLASAGSSIVIVWSDESDLIGVVLGH